MQTDLGTNTTAYYAMYAVSVDPKAGESVTITNVAGSSLSYYSDTASSAAGSITAGNSKTFTQPVWIQSRGRTTTQITGGKYGAV